MTRRYFEFKGLRYDMGTTLTVKVDGEEKKTTYLGFGRFDGVSADAEVTIVTIDSPKYFVEKYTK